MNRILFISHLQIFPPESGGQLRSANICQALANRGFQVELFTLTGRRKDYLSRKKSSEISISQNISEYTDRRALFGILQWLCYKLHLPPLWVPWAALFLRSKILKSFFSRADIIMIDNPFLYLFLKGRSQRKILNTHNIEHHLWQSNTILSLLIAPLVKYLEQRASLLADTIVTCSLSDQSFFKQTAPGKNQLIIPNGVLPKTFVKNEHDRDNLRKELGLLPTEVVLLFTASFYRPNQEGLEFLRDFAKKHESFLQDLGMTFLAVGSVSQVKFQCPGLIITSIVEKMEPYFSCADIAINPIFSGSGTNVKLAQYIAAHLPILTTAFGTRGYNLLDGKSCLIFNDLNLKETLRKAISKFKDRKLNCLANQAMKDNESIIDINTAIEPLAAWLHNS